MSINYTNISYVINYILPSFKFGVITQACRNT